MVYQVIQTCRHCGGSNLSKNGHRPDGTQRWRCNACKKSFQMSYTYNANKPGLKEQITTLTLNACGVRDTARILGISKGTVIRELKKKCRLTRINT